MKRLCNWLLAASFLGLVIAIGVVQSGCGSGKSYFDQAELSRSPAAGGARSGSGYHPALPSGARGQLADKAVIDRQLLAECAPGETELWIIERRPVAGPPDDKLPGAGALLGRPMPPGADAKPPKEDELIPVPLKHTDVKASIAGYIAAVDVTQQYHNPFSEKIEATYVFPLPHNAAVNDFIMSIGDRKIRGIIREREEAKRIYTEARNQGYVASLLTQERPNIFTQTVGNIEPGKQIDINIRYYHTLSPVDGWYEFVFPMVVGPRFNPPSAAGVPSAVGALTGGARGNLEDRDPGRNSAGGDTGGTTAGTGIGAVPRNSPPGASGHAVQVPYLRPNERSGHDISLAASIDGLMPIEDITCTSHQVTMLRNGPSKATVEIAAADTIPNKDFILRYRLASADGEQVKSGAIVQKDPQGGGHFALLLVPPQSLNKLKRAPVEMIFTLDVSGSMSGWPEEQSKDAIRRALTKMQPGDTFNVIRFANNAESLWPASRPATADNISRAIAYAGNMQAGGGTMMLEGIKKSLLSPRDESRLRFVAFLTDGYIGNEAEILSEIDRDLAGARIFSFGVGTSVNRYLLEHMAKVGRGAAAFLTHDDTGEEVMGSFFERISHPAMTDVTLETAGTSIKDVYPRRIPDLFPGRPVIITGRYTGKLDGAIHITARINGQEHDIAVPISAGDRLAAQALPSLWARSKIGDILDEMACGRSADGEAAIKSLALSHSLMSPFTAFVAVDASRKTEGDHGVSIQVPVPVPQGVRYDTTVEK